MRGLFTFVFFLAATLSQATIRYVKVSATGGNGLSWAAAYNNIQTAIDVSANGDEIWIAAGTYTPGASLVMKSGVKIYGGFAGTETLLSQRNWVTNVVMISGNNNKTVFNHDGKTINSAALLDGVTITNGLASYGGGGMYNPGTAVPTLRNIVFKNNTALVSGGGLYSDGGGMVMENVVFQGNTAAENGGGFYSDGAYPSLTNCVFDHNTAKINGGGMYADTYDPSQKPALANVVFYANLASSGDGGGLYTNNSQSVLTNCTFVRNQCGASNGGGLYNNTVSGNTASTPQVTNCLFWGNQGNGTVSDIGASNSNPVYAYCAFQQTAPSGTGNVQLTASDPFVNNLNGPGNDKYWGNADDGLQLRFCYDSGNSLLMDKGSNSAISVATDFAGQPRKVDVPLITDGGNGTAPVVDIGAYESQDTTSLTQLTGSIGNAHLIPYPNELPADFITSASIPAQGTTIRWQKNDEGSWVAAPVVSPPDSVGYRFPKLAKTTDFRRVVRSAAYCNVDYPSNVVKITVVNSNGLISGKVLSKNQVPVKGIVITAKRTIALPGSPANMIYTGTTDDRGEYSLAPLYFGDPANAASTADFIVTPSKPNHGFDPSATTQTLKYVAPQRQNLNFTDTTVLSITGRTFQQCSDCNDENGAPQVQVSALDSVEIRMNGKTQGQTTFIDTAYGRYAVTVTDPGLVTIDPRFKNHFFSPSARNINVTDNIAGVDFQDTSTRLITGRLSSGCDQYIGDAVLEFSDVLPNDKDGNPRSSTFRKRVNTNPGSGFYSVRLPARKYKVKVVDFTPVTSSNTNPAYINPLTLKDFINNKLPADSLVRDITERDTVLNLHYERPPVLQLVGLPVVCNNPSPFALMQQEVVGSFVVKVFQGDPSFGCPVRDTNKIRVFTNIHKADNTPEEIRFAVSDDGTQVKLKGGTPNIIAPYMKDLNIQFTDRFGRSAANLSRNVVVTGVKADIATFTTVSPEIPLLVLHDPPGDNSYSFWESNQSIQTAMRMYTAKSNTAAGWLEAKIGTKFEAGIGVSVETSIWGTIRGDLSVGSSNTTSNETILTTTALQRFETSSSSDVTGSDGDLYVGAALNLIYAGSTEIKYSNCAVTSGRKLIVANNGFATQYVYTERHIRDNVIPSLTALAQNPGNTPQQTANFQNQIKVWQQILENNKTNKALAKYDKNISFDGSAGPITNQTTSSVSKSSTVEFAMTIDATVAASLGLEIGGSGVSGGVSVNFKTETGSSNSGTVTKETTTGYVLDDDDPGDYFSVNVKKDPVYNTPVFEMVAGTSSCPNEEGTQPRDEVQLRAPVPAVNGVPANGDAVFELFIGNTSQSGEERTYLLSFDQTSNPDAAAVTIGGSPVLTPIQFTIGYLGEAKVTVNVKKNAAKSVFAYEGLRFTATDQCGGQSKSVLLSAYFVNNCSNVKLEVPEDGWVLASGANNLLPVIVKDYTKSSLTSVTLEYSKAGTSNWTEGATWLASQLDNDGTIGTQFNWNVSSLTDGAYNLRLKLLCPSGTVYSQRASGIIDRKAPELFGKPQPASDVYVFGDVISFTYNEKLEVSSLNNKPITLRRLSNNQLIPVTVTGFDNKIVIAPGVDLSTFVLDSFQVVVSGITDQYGNVRSKNDTSTFVVSSFTPATGANALTLAVLKPVVFKNADSSIEVYFNLPVNAPNDMRINFNIGGTARYGVDYLVQYNTPQPLFTSFNGSFGTILIPKNSRQAMLKLVPVKDSTFKPDQTIIISLMDGGDYSIGQQKSILGTLTSEDGVTIYTFTGNGNFSEKTNWQNLRMPMTTLPAGKTIIIDPSGTCIADAPLTISPGAQLILKQGKTMTVNKK